MHNSPMFRIAIIIVGVFTIWSTPVQARSGVYLGVGGSYAYSEIDTEDISVLDDVDVTIDFGDTYGFNARIGWRLIDLLALEFNFDYLPGFESDDIIEIIEIVDFPVSAQADLQIMTLMVDAKLIPIRLGPFEMGIFGGIGLMNAELEVSARGDNSVGAASISADDTLLCGELGLGLGVALGDRATLNLEGSYVGAFGEFSDYEYGIGYVLITAGVDFYF
jgi:hypothetical protein